MKKLIAVMLCLLYLMTCLPVHAEPLPHDMPECGFVGTDVALPEKGQYRVFSGPGEDYMPAADGGSLVTLEGFVQVFGAEGDWAFIRYAAPSGDTRFGYVLLGDLPAGTGADSLKFLPRDAYLTRRAAITDDPLGTQEALLTLPEGLWVTWLANMGDWAYVECMTGMGEKLRGFIPADAMASHQLYWLEHLYHDADAAALTGVLSLREGFIALRVDTWQTRDGQPPVRFAVYDAETMAHILDAMLDTSATYRGTAELTGMDEMRSVFICPVWTEDGEADMEAALAVDW